MKTNQKKNTVAIISLIVITFISVLCFCSCKKDNVNVNPTKYSINYIAEVGGYIEGEANQTVEYGNSTITVTAIPNEGYKFVEWSDGVTTETRTETNVKSDITVTAIFEKLSYYIIYQTDGNGTIKGETKQTVGYGESANTVTAVPNEGYKFVKWSDGVANANRKEIKVTSDITVTAIFEKLSYSVIYDTDGNGTIAGETNQTIICGESGTIVKAVPAVGYKFIEWSDGKTAPERRDINIIKNQNFTAIFEKIIFTVRYDCKFGMLAITTANGNKYAGPYVEFKVEYGEDCEKITAISSLIQNYIFVGWSDGINKQERQELNVTSDIIIRAKFGYELKYKVEGDAGGKIIGNCRQLIEEGEDSLPVEAVANEGYVFCGWSDIVMGTTHQIKEMPKSLEYIAYFEPIEKTFRYEYGIAAPFKTEITINRNNLNESVFEIPQKSGYVFRGWYADNDYNLKVVHESGKLMLGLQTLNLETDTLYARWEKVGEEKKTYKILMIMVDEILATLYSTKISQNILIDYKMSGIERKICSVIPSKLSQYINKWFEGKVIFEFDTYYTREVIGNECFSWGIDSTGHRGYDIFGDKIVEISDIINEYDCTMVTFSMNDFATLLHNEGGLGTAKMALVRLEGIIHKEEIYSNHNVLEGIIKYTGDGEVDEYFSGLQVIVGYFHEFCHTIEMRYYYNSLPEFSKYTEEVYKFHEWGAESDHNQLDTERLYLLGLGVLDGKTIGIPHSYWEEFYN